MKKKHGQHPFHFMQGTSLEAYGDLLSAGTLCANESLVLRTVRAAGRRGMTDGEIVAALKPGHGKDRASWNPARHASWRLFLVINSGRSRVFPPHRRAIVWMDSRVATRDELLVARDKWRISHPISRQHLVALRDAFTAEDAGSSVGTGSLVDLLRRNDALAVMIAAVWGSARVGDDPPGFAELMEAAPERPPEVVGEVGP